jgi:NitT/TauT family transport system ATP-binding protein
VRAVLDGGPPAARLQALRVGKDFEQPRRAGRTAVLDDITLEVAPGEFVAIVGPSGCGKTTLLLVLDGLVAPTRGEVLIDGHPISSPGRDRAMVFQDPALLPWRSTLGNIAYGLECLKTPRLEALSAARRWLEAVGLRGFEEHYPHELSGGMQQRTNLARALAVNPAILLMDEPFAALDALTREGLQGELLALWARTRKTVVFITHSIPEAIYLADRVVVLTPRPARVRGTIRVELSRPRDHSVYRTAWFRDCEDYVRSLLAGCASLPGAPELAAGSPDTSER